MLTRSDLPAFFISDTDAHISKAGIWVYVGGGAASWTIAPAGPSPRATDAQTYFIKVRASAGPLTINRSNADTFAHGTTNPTSITIQPGHSVLLVPSTPIAWEVLYLSPTITNAVSVFAGSTHTLDRNASVRVHNGAATTWTLPALANNTGLTYQIKNRGTDAITLQRAGTDQIYDTSAVTSISIQPGGSVTIINDGTFWLVL